MQPMTETRDAPAVRILPPAVPLITILAGVGLERVWPIDLGVALPAPVRHWIGGAIIAGAVLGLGVWSIALFRRAGESEIPWTPTHRFQERGPYRLSRNPMYLQLILISIGVAILLASWWVLALTPLTAWVLQRFAIRPEEAYLERTFGDDYRAYKSRVRRWI